MLINHGQTYNLHLWTHKVAGGYLAAPSALAKGRQKTSRRPHQQQPRRLLTFWGSRRTEWPVVWSCCIDRRWTSGDERWCCCRCSSDRFSPFSSGEFHRPGVGSVLDLRLPVSRMSISSAVTWWWWFCWWCWWWCRLVWITIILISSYHNISIIIIIFMIIIITASIIIIVTILGP